jgi:hypothetical protein
LGTDQEGDNVSEPRYCEVRSHYCCCHDFGKRCDDFDDEPDETAKELVEKPMTDASKQTLMSIQKLLEGGITTPHKALVAAFSLGRLEGLAEMASIGQDKMKDLLEKAA